MKGTYLDAGEGIHGRSRRSKAYDGEPFSAAVAVSALVKRLAAAHGRQRLRSLVQVLITPYHRGVAFRF